jgi:hypothetical protein
MATFMSQWLLYFVMFSTSLLFSISSRLLVRSVLLVVMWLLFSLVVSEFWNLMMQVMSITWPVMFVPSCSLFQWIV